MKSDKPAGVKSAYEAALERLEKQGIAAPDVTSISDQAREKIAEARRRAEAKLAEAEIFHRQRLQAIADPAAREQEEENYARERRRIEDEREREVAKARG